MTHDSLIALILILGFGAGVLIRWRWNLWRYPHNACPRCGGDGEITRTTLTGKKQVGPCRHYRYRNHPPDNHTSRRRW